MDDYVSSDDEYCWDEEDDGDSLNGFEDPEREFQWQSEKGPSTKVITKESLLAAQREDLQRVMELLSLKEHHARTLLVYYRWDVDKVFAVFVEKGKDQLYAEAGVTVEEHNDLSLSQCSSEVMCDICMEEVPANQMTTMDCGHFFCNNCWTEHFIVKINEGQSRRIRCMAHKCTAICEEGKIRNLVCVRDTVLAKKFDRFLLESYIEDNKRVKWCPSVPHCGNAIRVEDDEYCEVECTCGVQFCFSCSSEAHSPCSCLMWELWTKKCKDESETVNWITVNTKPCPKCHKPTEKNGGCNLVRCICGQYFCWLCAGATGSTHTWNSIRGHSCGLFTENHVKKIERAKQELWRYIHYHNHYEAHTDSFKAEVQLKKKVQVKISKLEARKPAFKDSNWVTNGLYKLFRSRRVLSYSYPFAYYMFGEDLFKNEMTKNEREIKQNLFEDHQQQLEANVEKLSLFLEEPFDEYDEDKVMDTRMQIITLSKIADERCKKLYECIEHDLLGPLQHATHIIASYKSKGVEKASEHPEKNSAMFNFEAI
uniref:RBR-type E3 ubiquitin transferase n=1 Tax=Davidia involucrata TaxID=16924 RepID=A0A5B6ZXV4_DAVIN